MEQRPPQAMLDSARASYTAIQQIKFGLFEEIKRIEDEPQLSRIGKDQKQLALRREARAKAAPLAEKAQQMQLDAEQRRGEFSLESFLIAAEFAAAGTQTDALERVHLASVLPRASIGELNALMTNAVGRKAAWRAGMIRRETLARVREDTVIPGENETVAATLAAATALTPPDAAVLRDALPQIQQFGNFIRIAMHDIGGLTV